MLGASVWGLVWYPLRMLARRLGRASGTAAQRDDERRRGACFVLLVRNAARSARSRWHWLLPALALLAAGVTNIGFVWGAIHGQVMRVLLLFYLTPAWTAMLRALHPARAADARRCGALALVAGGRRDDAVVARSSAFRCPPISPNGRGSCGGHGLRDEQRARSLKATSTRAARDEAGDAHGCDLRRRGAVRRSRHVLRTDARAARRRAIAHRDVIVIGAGHRAREQQHDRADRARARAGQPGVDHHAVRTRHHRRSRRGSSRAKCPARANGRAARASSLASRAVEHGCIGRAGSAAPRRSAARSPKTPPATARNRLRAMV